MSDLTPKHSVTERLRKVREPDPAWECPCRRTNPETCAAPEIAVMKLDAGDLLLCFPCLQAGYACRMTEALMADPTLAEVIADVEAKRAKATPGPWLTEYNHPHTIFAVDGSTIGGVLFNTNEVDVSCHRRHRQRLAARGGGAATAASANPALRKATQAREGCRYGDRYEGLREALRDSRELCVCLSQSGGRS